MPGNSVQLTQTVDDRDVVQALQRQLKLIDQIEKRLDDTGKAGDRAGKKTALSWANAKAAFDFGVQALGAFSEANQRIIQEADQIGQKYDEIFRRFNIQSGLRGIAGEQAQQRILQIAERNAVLGDKAFEAATQLVSSGFSAEEASGGSLDAFLKTLAATNAVRPDVDAAGLAQAVASYLGSQGLQKNAANVQDVGQRIQSLFLGTNLQIGDLAAFSKQASAFKGRLTSEEQFAGLSALRDVGLGGEEATTALRNFVAAVTSQKLSKDKVGVLSQLGISPDEIDLQGESFRQVLDRLAKARAAADPALVESQFAKFFEKAQVPAVLNLLDARERITGNIALQQQAGAGFDSALAEATAGRAAATRRQEVRRERRRLAGDGRDAIVGEEFEAAIEEAGFSPIQGGLAREAFEFSRGLGFGEETSLNVGLAREPSLIGDVSAQQVLQRVEQRQMAENNQLLGQAVGELRQLNHGRAPENDLSRRD